jgi:arylformamidase
VRLAEMVAQVRRAFLWLRARFGPVTVSGHSSGAHLAACLLDGRWWRAEGLGAADFGAVLLASGAYDLEPVRLSARNLYLTLDEAEAADLSPARHLADRLPPVAAVWGDGELPEFARQSRALGAALRSRRADAVVEALRDRNHFDVWDDFADPASRVCALLRGLPGGRTEGAPGHIAERGIAGGPPA